MAANGQDFLPAGALLAMKNSFEFRAN
jgi:hypothetical protein